MLQVDPFPAAILPGQGQNQWIFGESCAQLFSRAGFEATTAETSATRFSWLGRG